MAKLCLVYAFEETLSEKISANHLREEKALCQKLSQKRWLYIRAMCSTGNEVPCLLRRYFFPHGLAYTYLASMRRMHVLQSENQDGRPIRIISTLASRVNRDYQIANFCLAKQSEIPNSSHKSQFEI